MEYLRLELRNCRRLLLFFIVALALSGITAFPLEWELDILKAMEDLFPAAMANWINTIATALRETNAQYPFLAYGTDWLAFAHLVIAVGFIGPYIDPVRNKWVVIHGMIACVMIFPLAFIAGSIRGIPLFWMLIDCSFGVVGLIPLYYCLRSINRIEKVNPQLVIKTKIK